MGVRHARAEEEVQDPGQHGVADVAMQPGHRPRLDVVHAVAHHQLCTGPQLGDETRDLAEVISQIGVRHHDVVAPRGGEAGAVCRAVAAPGLKDHARAGRLCDLGAAVLRIVVDDDHLALEASRQER